MKECEEEGRGEKRCIELRSESHEAQAVWCIPHAYFKQAFFLFFNTSFDSLKNIRTACRPNRPSTACRSNRPSIYCLSPEPPVTIYYKSF